MELRKSSLEDEAAVQELYRKIIAELNIEGNYMILLAHDNYDVPYRTRDGETDRENSTEAVSTLSAQSAP